MAFVNEIVSDDDIDAYGLPFKKGSGRYWTRDAERDYYLWGGKGGNPAFGEEIRGIFYLGLSGQKTKATLRPGRGSLNYSEVPYVIAWDSILRFEPETIKGLSQEALVAILKEALVAYGEDGRTNKFAPTRRVRFDF